MVFVSKVSSSGVVFVLATQKVFLSAKIIFLCSVSSSVHTF